MVRDEFANLPIVKVDTNGIREILYQKKHKLIATGYDSKDDAPGYGVFEDGGKLYRAIVSQEEGATHLLTLKVVNSPTAGPRFAKSIDNNQHWQDMQDLVHDLPKKVVESRTKLVAGDLKIDFDWASLLHDAFEEEHKPFDKRFVPLKQNYHALMGHVELLGMKCVQRGEKMAVSSLHKDSQALVTDTLGFVQPGEGFAMHILNVPGGPPRLEKHVSNLLATFHQVVDELTQKKVDARTACFTLMAIYGGTLEMLRIPLLVLAKSAEKNQAAPKGNTDGRFTPLLEFLTSHPKVGKRYAHFLDPGLRHHFAHSAYQIEGADVMLLDRDLQTVLRTISLSQLVTLVQELLVNLAPAAINGALLSYYTDVRLMMQTRPYLQWVVGIGNTK